MAPVFHKLLNYLPPILLLIALLVALTMAYRVWAEIHEEDESDDDGDLLEELEQARAAGEIDDAELRRVRDLLNKPKLQISEPSRFHRKPLDTESSPPLPDTPHHPMFDPDLDVRGTESSPLLPDTPPTADSTDPPVFPENPIAEE